MDLETSTYFDVEEDYSNDDSGSFDAAGESISSLNNSDLKQEMEELKQVNKKHVDELKNTVMKLQESEDMNLSLERQVVSTRNELTFTKEKHQKTLDDYKEEIRYLSEALSAKKDSIDSNTKMFYKLEKELNDLKAERDEMKRELEKFYIKEEQSSKAKQNLKESQDALELEVTAYSIRCNQLEIENQKITSMMNELKTTIAGFENDRVQLENEILYYRTKAEELRLVTQNKLSDSPKDSGFEVQLIEKGFLPVKHEPSIFEELQVSLGPDLLQHPFQLLGKHYVEEDEMNSQLIGLESVHACTQTTDYSLKEDDNKTNSQINNSTCNEFIRSSNVPQQLEIRPIRNPRFSIITRRPFIFGFFLTLIVGMSIFMLIGIFHPDFCCNYQSLTKYERSHIPRF